MRYFSTFSGIGGFELGIQQAYEKIQGDLSIESTDKESRPTKPEIQFGGIGSPLEEGHSVLSGDGRTRPVCVGYSEIDKYAVQIYEKHFNHKNYGDITKLSEEDIRNLPRFELLVGGFPCQAFSIAGKRGGFSDTRGTLFFEIARIVREKQPRLLVLENVKGLLSHDKGKTFFTIISTLDELGYDCEWQVLNSKNHGVPQNRERIFIIGNRRGTERPDVFPMNSVVQCENDKTTINEKVYAMSEELTPYATELLLGMAQSKREKLSKSEMQGLFKEVEQGLQQSQCIEVEREPQEVRQESERDIQEVETLDSFLEGANHTKDLCGVVQIPTEDMLLLWSKGGGATQRIGQLQQQDESPNSRQARLDEALRRWELSSLLFAVQPYQGQLFYSIGDGTDWVNVYQTKVETTCKTNDLSSILEEHPDPKYFLSDKIVERLMTYRDNTQTPLRPATKERRQSARTLLKVNSMHKK